MRTKVWALLGAAAAGCGQADAGPPGGVDAAAPLGAPEAVEAVEAGVSCPPAVPLSKVGQAMSSVAGPATPQRATCAGFPADWLTSIDQGDLSESNGSLGCLEPRGGEYYEYFRRARDLLARTRSSFSHSALYSLRCYGFETAILSLHQALGPTGSLAESQKPVLRFYYGHHESSPLGTYQRLTGPLRQFAGDDPSKWNVRIAVARSENLASWNHTKMTVRDGVEVVSASVETDHHEVALHLSGPPATDAQQWFDILWDDESRSSCFAPDGKPQGSLACCSLGACAVPCAATDATLCGKVAGFRDTLPAAPADGSLPPNQAVNVLSLDRGRITFGLQTEFWNAADKAVYAGVDAAERSIFFLNPSLVGLNGVTWPIDVPDTENFFSGELLRHLVARAAGCPLGGGFCDADPADVKFVWGGATEFKIDEYWPRLDEFIDQQLTALHVSDSKRAAARCRLRVAPFASADRSASHAKFFMLDKGFYVGSQNMYPTGLSGHECLTLGPACNIPVPDLKEQGFFVDADDGVNEGRYKTARATIAEPAWLGSKANLKKSASTDCAHVPHPIKLHAAGDTGSGGPHFCDVTFSALLDFNDVGLDEQAKVVGTGVCRADGLLPVNVRIEGTIDTRGELQSGSISGSVQVQGKVYSDTAELSGSYKKDQFFLTFSGLEPVSGVSYSGSLISDRVAPKLVGPAQGALVPVGGDLPVVWEGEQGENNYFLQIALCDTIRTASGATRANCFEEAPLGPGEELLLLGEYFYTPGLPMALAFPPADVCRIEGNRLRCEVSVLEQYGSVINQCAFDNDLGESVPLYYGVRVHAGGFGVPTVISATHAVRGLCSQSRDAGRQGG
jgi:hypothetical protein